MIFCQRRDSALASAGPSVGISAMSLPAEGPSAPRHDDHGHALGTLEVSQRALEGRRHGAVEGVEGLGPLESQPRDRALDDEARAHSPTFPRMAPGSANASRLSGEPAISPVIAAICSAAKRG